MAEFIQICFHGPPLIASILLLLVSLYWLFVIVGFVGVDMLDFDLDVDVDADLDVDVDADLDVPQGSVLGVGFVALRFLNLGRVPFMLWLSMFALSFWVMSLVMNQPSQQENLGYGLLVMTGAIGISLFLAKLLTQPLRGKFDPVEPNRAKDLIGKTCEVTTSEVTESFGQARFRTESAPLSLNVRSQQGGLAKGDLAEIVRYDRVKHIYFIAKVNREGEK